MKGQLTYSTERTSSPETESDFDSPAKEYHNDDENVSTGILSSTAKRLIINHVTFPTERSDKSAHILYSHNIDNFKSNIINHSTLGCYNYIFNSCSHNVIGKCLNICFSIILISLTINNRQAKFPSGQGTATLKLGYFFICSTQCM